VPDELDLRRFFDTAPVGMYRSTAAGRFVFANRALVTLLGYDSTAEVLGLDIARDVYVDSTDRQAFMARSLEAGFAEGGVDVRWRRKGGDIINVRLYPRAVRSDAGDLEFDTTVFDMTELRRMEERVADAQRAERLGVLAGGLAHDFNNLLVAILGNADLALRDPAGGRDLVANIRVAAMRAGELTQQLLAYAGGEHRVVVDVDVAPMVSELVGLLAPTTPADVALRGDVPPGLPAVRADASQLRQVILNLITNARDATTARGGDVRVEAWLVHHDGSPTSDDVLTPAAGRYVVVAVTDDGAGVDPGMRQRIFDPFFTTKAAGHGLGLAAVLGIVRDHGGGLRVASHTTGGARFEAWWPAVANGESVRLPTPVPTPVLNVMVVDDEDLVRDVLARMVEDLGYSVIAVADGAEALAVADRAEVALDAVILDLTMPAMSGRAVLAGLRSRRPDVPIVLCSGYDRERDAAAVSGDAFLRKPFRLEELEKILAELTSRD
jgi:two-component system, cell cycle sensor histidine kinase and response regulator CckA